MARSFAQGRKPKQKNKGNKGKGQQQGQQQGQAGGQRDGQPRSGTARSENRQGGLSRYAAENPASAPLTGDGFREWSDRLRDVEEMVDDPNLRSQAARMTSWDSILVNSGLATWV